MKLAVIGSAELLDLTGETGKAGYLLSQMKSLGYRVDSNRGADCLIAIDHNESQYNKYLANGGNPKNCFLIRLEPKCVFPSQYSSRVEKKYRKIFSPGLLQNSGELPPQFGWVYRYDLNPINLSLRSPTLDVIFQGLRVEEKDLFENWKKRNIRLSMITGNKVSPIRNSNYPLRRKLAKKIGGNELKIFGTLWIDPWYIRLIDRLAGVKFALQNRTLPDITQVFQGVIGKYPSAGAIRNKHEILSSSQFTIAIENSNTYVSEKLFDALVNGTIPIYIGPELESAGLPSEIAIQSTGESEDILEVISTITQEQVKKTLAAGQEFLLSAQFRDEWTETSVYRKIALEINEMCKGT
jgi:hypothetical protein